MFLLTIASDSDSEAATHPDKMTLPPPSFTEVVLTEYYHHVIDRISCSNDGKM